MPRSSVSSAHPTNSKPTQHMKTDAFVNIVMTEIVKSSDVTDTSFLRSSVRGIGRKFESQAIDISGVLAELEGLLPWQLNRDIKKSIEKALR